MLRSFCFHISNYMLYVPDFFVSILPRHSLSSKNIHRIWTSFVRLQQICITYVHMNMLALPCSILFSPFTTAVTCSVVNLNTLCQYIDHNNLITTDVASVAVNKWIHYGIQDKNVPQEIINYLKRDFATSNTYSKVDSLTVPVRHTEKKS